MSASYAAASSPSRPGSQTARARPAARSASRPAVGAVFGSSSGRGTVATSQAYDVLAMVVESRRARPVRVLFVNDTARNGGPPRSLCTLLSHLDPARVHRAVVLPRLGIVADELRAARA